MLYKTYFHNFSHHILFIVEMLFAAISFFLSESKMEGTMHGENIF
jgi:hypothetical protein